MAYASRALTPKETNYAQIEMGLLAIIAFGIEPFEGYVYGRKIFIDPDHKTLESIMKISRLSAPKRLQRILLHSQTYRHGRVCNHSKTNHAGNQKCY